jgi:hypothetical protein
MRRKVGAALGRGLERRRRVVRAVASPLSRWVRTGERRIEADVDLAHERRADCRERERIARIARP